MMIRKERRPIIAFMSVGSDNFYADTYQVHGRAGQTLLRLSGDWGFTLRDVAQELRTPEDVRRERDGLLGADLLLVQCAALCDGSVLYALCELGVPIGIWALDEPAEQGEIQLHSALTANLFAGIHAKCFQASPVAKWFYGEADDEDFQKRLRTTVDALRAVRGIKGARICQVGGEAPGFYSFREDPRVLSEKLDLTVDTCGIERLISLARTANEAEAESLLPWMCEGARCRGVTRAELLHSARVCLALGELAAQGGYDALAVSCWPALQERYGIVPCLAFSAACERFGFPVACEGDVMGAASMLLLGAISHGQATLMDLTRIDRAKDEILMWHCGFSPWSLAGGPREISHHPMMGRRLSPPERMGASQNFSLRDGGYTVCRLSGHIPRLFAFRGRVRSGRPVYDGTGGWLGGLSGAGGALRAIEVFAAVCENGVEHHYALCRGDCLEALCEASARLGLAQAAFAPREGAKVQ